MITKAQVTKHGQYFTTIPVALAQALKMEQGSKLEWTILPGQKLAIEKVA